MEKKKKADCYENLGNPKSQLEKRSDGKIDIKNIEFSDSVGTFGMLEIEWDLKERTENLQSQELSW